VYETGQWQYFAAVVGTFVGLIGQYVRWASVMTVTCLLRRQKIWWSISPMLRQVF